MKKSLKIIGIISAVFFFFGILFFLPFNSFAAEDTQDVGFIPDNIWYSNSSPAEGDTLRVYTLIFNSSDGTLSGTVEFYDDAVLLGKKPFSVPAQSSKDVYISWKASAGDHTIHAEIVGASISRSSGKTETLILQNDKTNQSKIFVPKTIVPQKNETTNSGENVSSSGIYSEVKNISSKVADKAGEYTSSVENFRTDAASYFESVKKSSNADIEEINSVPLSKNQDSKIPEANSFFRKTLDYSKLWSAYLMSFIFSHKLAFYLFLFLVVFLAIRFVWNKIFNKSRRY